MNETLGQRVRAYLEPPACRVPLAAVSIAFQNGHAIESGVITAGGEGSHASITAESRFVVQSITKSFTAAVILRLVASRLHISGVTCCVSSSSTPDGRRPLEYRKFL